MGCALRARSRALPLRPLAPCPAPQPTPLRRCLCVYGGVPKPPQVQALKQGVELLVGTPGRLEDLMNEGSCRLSQVGGRSCRARLQGAGAGAAAGRGCRRADCAAGALGLHGVALLASRQQPGAQHTCSC
jgi:hypothetical protein